MIPVPVEFDLLGYQRRDIPLGEIRIGTSVPNPTQSNPGRRKPVRLDTLRFTSPVEHNALTVAEKLGGELRPWDQRRGYWEVTTPLKSIHVYVPPRELAVDVNMELWVQGKLLRQCSGRAMSFPRPDPGQDRHPCMCPADPDERARLAGQNPPKACKPKTTYRMAIPQLPGLTGVWTARTSSLNAALRTADSGHVLAMAQANGAYLPAILYIHWQQRLDDGSPYPVLSLMPSTSMEELARGELPSGPVGLVAQLQAAAPAAQSLAITAGTAPREKASAGAIPAPRPTRPPTAQEIADAAADATTLAELSPLKAQANEHRLNEDMICPRGSDVFEELSSYLFARREEIEHAAEGDAA